MTVNLSVQVMLVVPDLVLELKLTLPADAR